MSAEFSIFKSDDDKRLVFGWASVAIRADGTQIEDWQGDMIDPDDLEEAVYEYVLNFRDAGEEHIPTMRKKGKLVESVVFTKEKMKAMGIPEGIVPEGWWIGFKVHDDEAWAKIKSGEYRMFSIEGSGVREPVVQKSVTFRDILTKFNPNHGPDGRFTSGPKMAPDGGSGGGGSHGFDVKSAVSATMENGGGTFDPRNGETPTKGFCVATATQNERVIRVDASKDVESIARQYEEAFRSYLNEMGQFFEENPSYRFGTWIDEADGALYLDTPELFSDKSEAIEAGKRTNQIAIFDLESHEEIRLGVEKAMPNKDRKFVGMIDPKSKDVNKQIKTLARKAAVKTKLNYNREHGIVDRELEAEWEMINKGMK